MMMMMKVGQPWLRFLPWVLKSLLKEQLAELVEQLEFDRVSLGL